MAFEHLTGSYSAVAAIFRLRMRDSLLVGDVVVDVTQPAHAEMHLSRIASSATLKSFVSRYTRFSQTISFSLK